MFITDLSPSCFRGRIRPCNKRRHLRQSLATTCTCLITVSLKLVSPFCSSFFLHCAPISGLVFSELFYFLSFQVGAVLMFNQFLSSENMTYPFPTPSFNYLDSWIFDVLSYIYFRRKLTISPLFCCCCCCWSGVQS